MTVKVFLRGGLGNQLFQYAAGLYLSRKQSENLVLRTDLLPLQKDSIGKVSRFPVQVSDFRFEGNFHHLTNQPPGKTHSFSKILQLQRIVGDKFPRTFSKLGILAGDGSWIPDFEKVKRIWMVNSYATSCQPATLLGDELRNQIRSLINQSHTFTEMSEEVRALRPVVVHVRLGDYRSMVELYGRTNFEKLELVVQRVRESSSNPVWLFTDSPEDINEELIQKLGISRLVGPEQLPNPLENMLLMSLGYRLVCANSTFSWWSAFLKGEGKGVYFPTLTESPITIFSKNMILPGWEAYEAD